MALKRPYRREYFKEYYFRFKEKNGMAPVTAWRRANPEAAKKHREAEEQRRRRCPEVQAAKTLRHALNKHRLTLDQFHSMFERFEENGCPICGSYELTPHIDHNHTTGKIRKMLCALCNKGLGLFRDSPELLRQAAFYLESEWM